MNALKPRPSFQVLVMSEESRLGREAIETAYALKQLVQAGVRVFFYLEDRERTLDSPTDKIMLSLTTFADELEREKARQRTYDAMQRKAKAGHVTGGRVFGCDNLEIVSLDGRRSHVERRINEREASTVRRIFEMSAAGHGVRTIAKRLNADGEPAPRAQHGRPVSWSPSSIWELLRRPLYRGEIVWNKSRKCDAWGIKHQRPRAIDEWITTAAPELRIVSQALWSAVHDRLAGAREDYSRRNAGRVWGRPVNGLILRICSPGWRSVGSAAADCSCTPVNIGGAVRGFTPARTIIKRGRQICANNHVWPMELIDGEVLEAFREDLLNPVVLDRALAKLRTRLPESPSRHDEQVARLNAERERLERELFRLSAAWQRAPRFRQCFLRSASRRRDRRSSPRSSWHARAVVMLSRNSPMRSPRPSAGCKSGGQY